MADSLAICSKELDILFQAFFIEYAKYRALRSKLSAEMKDGFLYISKSRYSMGVGCVSELQIPEDEFLPLIESRPVENENRELLAIEFLKYPSKLDRKINETNDVKSDKEESLSGSTLSSVRRRNVGQVKDVNSTQDKSTSPARPTSDQNTKGDDVEMQARKDPLKWFGVLVPSSLRLGQRYFQHATETVCMVATSKLKLEQLIKDFQNLLEKKKQLMMPNVEDISSNGI
eukprot:gene10003-11027_t